MMHVINAAKCCISLHCKSQRISTLKEWIYKIDRIADMEELISISQVMASRYTVSKLGPDG